MKLTTTLFALTLTIGALSTALASPPYRPSLTPSDSGQQAVPAQSFDRTIEIGSSTRAVNVKRFETVRFVIITGGATREFVQHIDTRSSSLALSSLAPQEAAQASNVTVYVEPDRVSRQ